MGSTSQTKDEGSLHERGCLCSDGWVGEKKNKWSKKERQITGKKKALKLPTGNSVKRYFCFFLTTAILTRTEKSTKLYCCLSLVSLVNVNVFRGVVFRPNYTFKGVLNKG